MNQQKIGNFIVELRRKNKLTQGELASLIYVARETVGKWERGVNVPDTHSLVLLSKLFHVSINEIIAGEYINDSNKERINTFALNLIAESNKKIKKKNKIIIFIIVLAIFIFFFTYFIYNFNSTRVYLISGENEDYALSRSLIVISKQKSYIQIGSIVSKKTNTNIASEKDYKVSVYYNKDNLLFSSVGSDTLYTSFNNNETINSKKMTSIIDNLYLIIEEENDTSKIELNARLDYVNNHFFWKKFGDEELITKTNIVSNNYVETISDNIKSNENLKVIEPVDYETDNKKLSLSATCSESENVCHVVFVTTWKGIPKTKSYDLVGVRLSNTIFIDDNYVSLANDKIKPIYNYQSYRGLGSLFKLNDEETFSITQTFNVEYRGSIYASYQHASKKVPLVNAKQFNFSSTGYGEVFSWESKEIKESYDDMPGIKLILKEEK